MSSGDHNKNISAVRTFAADLMKHRKENQSASAIGEKTAPDTKSETIKNPDPAQTPPPAPKIVLAPLAPKKTTRGASSYLSHSATDTDTPPHTTPPEQSTQKMTYRTAPSIPKTAVMRELEHVGRVEKTSILSDEGNLQGGGQNDGVIIEDKKRDRFKLLPAIGSAIGNWAKEKTSEISEQKAPVHTITKAEARLDTIEAAAKASKRAPQEDYAQVAERLKEVERKTVDSRIMVKEKTAMPAPSWSYVNEEDTPAIVEPVIVPMNDQRTASKTDTLSEQSVPNIVKNEAAEPETPTHHSWVPAQKVPAATSSWPDIKPEVPVVEEMPAFINQDVFPQTPTPAAPQVVESVATLKPDITAPSPEPAAEILNKDLTAPAPTSWSNKNETVSQATSYQQDVAYVTSSTIPKPSLEFATELREAALRKKVAREAAEPDRKTLGNLTPIILAAGVGILAAIIITVNLIGFGSEPETTSTAVVVATPLTNGETKNLPFSNDHTTLLNTLTAEKTAGDNLRTLWFSSPEQSVIEPTTLISTLLPQASDTLKRNIKNTTLGYTDNNQPFVVLKGSSYDTLFGGLIASEKTMSQSLAPWFGLPNAGSYKDAIVANRPARILTDARGDEVLMYVFLTDTIVAITNDRNTVISIQANLVP